MPVMAGHIDACVRYTVLQYRTVSETTRNMAVPGRLSEEELYATLHVVLNFTIAFAAFRRVTHWRNVTAGVAGSTVPKSADPPGAAQWHCQKMRWRTALWR